jgi:hypothetical protein
MSAAPPLRPFQARLPDAARILSWIHIGDLHMTRAGEQNDLALFLFCTYQETSPTTAVHPHIP